MRKKNKMSIYHGYNIHSYTKQVISIIPRYFGDIAFSKVDNEKWKSVLLEIEKKISNSQAIQNIKRNFSNGRIIDPELPKVNSAMILVLIWDQIKNDIFLCKHFSETLKQVGNTCIQGISHRLIIDYVALYNDILYQNLSVYFTKKLTNTIVSYV